MTALVTVEDVLDMLDQIPAGEHDVLLDTICTEVQDTVELYLGFTFDGYTDATEQVAWGNGTPWLFLPPHSAGTVITVLPEVPTGSPTPNAITGWAEESDGKSLYLVGAQPGIQGRYPVSYESLYTSTPTCWGIDRRYVVTADWGYGTEWPLSVKEVATEIAVNIFKERTKGAFSDVIGVEGAGGDVVAAYQGALTKRQKMVLDLTRQKYNVLVMA